MPASLNSHLGRQRWEVTLPGMSQEQIQDMMIDGKLRSFTNVGGYPLFYLDKEDNCLCAKCATDDISEGADLSAVGINWETELWCDQCSEEIESAYGTPEE